MEFGPVEMVVISLPTDRPGPELVPVLDQTLASGDVRLLDLLFVAKDAQGEIRSLELGDLEGVNIGEEILDLVGADDIEIIAEGLQPETSAAVLIIEHVWAKSMSTAFRDLGGELALSLRIAPEVVEEVSRGGKQ